MDPTSVFCPNLACPARGQAAQGNIGVHSRKESRFICHLCKKTFAARAGTAFYRLRTPVDEVARIQTLLAHGCPPQAVVAAYGYDERTVASWEARAGSHARSVHEHLIEQPRDHGQVQADELRVKMQGRIVWMAMAVAVTSRLWLGGQVSQTRDFAFIRALLERVERCCRFGRLLLCVDGLAAYVRAARLAFRTKVDQGRGGRRALVTWPGLLIGQVVKQYERGRVKGVEQRAAHGTMRRLRRAVEATQGAGVINTAYIERLNATLRERMAALTRRGRMLSRSKEALEGRMWLVGTVYNFCTPHTSLRVAASESRAAKGRTPAMAAGITRRVWTVRELMEYRVPPPRWTPPPKWGRRSKDELALIERWC